MRLVSGASESVVNRGTWPPTLFSASVEDFGSTALTIILGVMAAYALSRIHFRGRQAYLNWILSQRFMPPIARSRPAYSASTFSDAVGSGVITTSTFEPEPRVRTGYWRGAT